MRLRQSDESNRLALRKMYHLLEDPGYPYMEKIRRYGN